MKFLFWSSSANTFAESQKPTASDFNGCVSVAPVPGPVSLPEPGGRNPSELDTEKNSSDEDEGDEKTWSAKERWEEYVALNISEADNRDHLCMAY